MASSVKILIPTLLVVVTTFCLNAQSFNAGFVFQYHVFKQIDVHSDFVSGTYSHDIFQVKENNWKAFSAGQSILIGMMAQMDYKKFYLATELSFNLNTYRYSLFYPIGPASEEKVIFKTLYQSVETALYIGYQFQSTNLVRYSLFSGVLVSYPMRIETFFEIPTGDDDSIYDRYSVNDMRYILYNEDPYLNGMIGFAVHVASLAKVDVRYIHRLDQPGERYTVNFNTIGLSLTYFLPLHLTRKKFYYEH